MVSLPDLLARRWPNFRLAEDWLARAKIDPARLGLILVMAPDEGVALERNTAVDWVTVPATPQRASGRATGRARTSLRVPLVDLSPLFADPPQGAQGRAPGDIPPHVPGRLPRRIPKGQSHASEAPPPPAECPADEG